MLNMVYIAQTGETGLMCYKIWKAGTLLKKEGKIAYLFLQCRSFWIIISEKAEWKWWRETDR